MQVTDNHGTTSKVLGGLAVSGERKGQRSKEGGGTAIPNRVRRAPPGGHLSKGQTASQGPELRAEGTARAKALRRKCACV